MKFYNREKERQRLIKATDSKKAKLIIVYGRRRCGKSTLIKNTLKPCDIYYMAQQSDESIQRMQLASTISEKIKGFDSVVYPNWESLFTNLNNVLKEPLTLCIDELPYLVKSSQSLPSVIQRVVDSTVNRKYHLILCGSSQQMMQGLILNSSAPLYGRADEILKITPLEAYWIRDALSCKPDQSIVEYSVWGGVPRYWELRAGEKSFKTAINNIVFDRFGVLHEEPARLFLDDMRESVQAYSILSVVGGGSNRLSEIAARLSKPATQLSRPIDNLIQLGYLKRVVPFGEAEKNSKKGIYRIADPFMNFYFTFLVPNLSRLELGLTEQVYKGFESRLANYVSSEWENLCRRSVPMKSINGIDFDIACRWWGTNMKNEPMELDVVAESTDKKYLLIGECKWSTISNPVSLMKKLEQKAKLFPLAKGKKIITVLYLKEVSEASPNVFSPSDVLERLQ
ncbi:MAG TPA: ATP-binding protein [Bacteroidales bacterium]|nr:ATP-binding protein [Bacteroidales bacterium]HPT11686.1 ATP-binding protein [Bacteroidales bacterium]